MYEKCASHSSIREKGGSIRVVYVDLEIREKLYLIAAYPKNEKDNLTKAERNELKSLVAILEKRSEVKTMRAFDKIKTGLNEAISYERGTLKADTHKMTVQPLAQYSASEIRSIRIKAGMTQTGFAAFMGVSKKTVEAWEAGKNHPAGAACRLLYLTEADPLFPQKSGILVQ